jgi:hypothetical protein
MLFVCSSVSKFTEFKEMFKAQHSSSQWVDISTIPSENLIEQCDAILNHHTDSCVFLGYLEPGWMLDPPHQTRMRTLFRKFSVGLVCEFPESIPFSWKNETETIYSS